MVNTIVYLTQIHGIYLNLSVSWQSLHIKKKQSSIVDLQENPNEESAVYNNIPTMIWLCKFTIANFDIENSHQINTNYCVSYH